MTPRKASGYIRLTPAPERSLAALIGRRRRGQEGVVMRRTWLRAIAAVLAACGLLSPAPVGAIVGGEEAEDHEWPWAVLVGDHVSGASQLTAASPISRCGGALIASTWVLTAAHCVSRHPSVIVRPPATLVLRLRPTHADDPESGERLVPRRIVVHPRYFWPDARFDVALVEVGEGSRRRLPIEVAGDDEEQLWAPGTSAWHVGWGVDDPTGSTMSDRLREVEVPIWSDAACAEANRRTRDANPRFIRVFDPATMVCAGADGKDGCSGDSGSPLMVRAPAGEWRVVGTNSWGGPNCGDRDHPGVYGRVAGDLLRDFIRQHAPKAVAGKSRRSRSGARQHARSVAR